MSLLGPTVHVQIVPLILKNYGFLETTQSTSKMVPKLEYFSNNFDTQANDPISSLQPSPKVGYHSILLLRDEQTQVKVQPNIASL